MVIDSLPAALRPLVQPIDTWFESRRLGLLFEAHVAGGSLMVCSMDLSSALSDRLAARQLRYSVMQYMQSKQFQPQTEVSLELLRGLFKKPTSLQQWHATIRADSQQPGFEAEQAIDGDPRSIWHSRWELTIDGPPCGLVLDLQQSRTLQGLRYLPRRDMSNGRIAKYQIYVSEQPTDWGEPAATGCWQDTSQWQTARFDQPQRGRYVKLWVESEVNRRPYASVAELDLLVAPDER